MLFQWDLNKNEINIKNHRIDFRDARDIFFDFHIIIPSKQERDEKRELAIGLLAGREITVVYTWRGNEIRLISARRARKDEREIFWSKV
ncbi:MAG: BrnT family toxin [Gemmatimonadetes bacterium]|nr:BrnT family toxin [Gemmatimonadota bacterium]MYC14250.1 BrnT family toxin [Gemmatimonadota bacterium]MYK53854.1 BrnT family toxin [Gemmatimonadota bacterium]